MQNLKVDSLMTEIDELATKQGEEEARKLKKEEETNAVNVYDLTQNERKLFLGRVLMFEYVKILVRHSLNI